MAIKGNGMHDWYAAIRKLPYLDSATVTKKSVFTGKFISTSSRCCFILQVTPPLTINMFHAFYRGVACRNTTVAPTTPL